jgi:hypothetical protein
LTPARARALASRSGVHALGGTVECDEPVAFDRGLPGHGVLGFAEVFIDAAQGAPSPVGAVLVVDRPVAPAAGLFDRAGLWGPNIRFWA